ncbi:hypothetical protein MNV49_005706 [Pseudohyphozyma bogoriensis]|nr:hypothetical protein MNV49_005706 [Pseudohyphozyma bogoriensis]
MATEARHGGSLASSRPKGTILRVGIAGAGEVAQAVHLPTLRLLSHLYKVVAICDVSQQSLAHCAEKFNIAKTFTDFSEMVKDPEVDLIMILTATYAVEAANNKKAVFIEKPMALSHAEAELILDAQQRNNVTIFVGYMRRYAPAFQVAKDIVSSLKSIDYVRVRDIVGLNKFFVNESAMFSIKFTDFPSDFSADRVARATKVAQDALGDKSSNPRDVATYRFLATLGSHDLSAMREIIGLPKSCFAATRSASGEFINALFEYEGFVASYETGIDEVAKFDAHIEVHGDGKRVKVTWDSPYIKGLPITTTILETNEDGHFQERVVRPTYKDPYTIELEELHKAITEGAPVKTTPEDAAQDLLVFDMVMGALRN